MILILIALVVGLGVTIAFLKYSNDVYTHTFVMGILGVILGTFIFIASLVYAFVGFAYIAAGHKANLINREYHTNYTQEEIFWAGDVVEIIKQINRQRIEVNGNLFKDN